ncbi:uncharacterized protein MELLADRAFT_87555 [Melampsora larici-populina 98AG31]|uniref:Uncharacterized protein n=1 Tax=Melampsora larici-populina (strain 98AG31 / pathotype 3-4-7) TaxID=747676 RepID=F4RNR8_MELLP|nr:uncharacterized protein MELLADRAFT_87555 [Melampsora larici-populina 98AG31]EGG06033.1 hypothetical protein MELLADRAFT_87555 [Melampsora larici-populina 98AG31]
MHEIQLEAFDQQSTSITKPESNRKLNSKELQIEIKYKNNVSCFITQTQCPKTNSAIPAHENPAIFWSIAIGSAGPVLLATVPPIRRNYFGYRSPEPIPGSYPLPNRSRDSQLSGYDD